MLEGSVLRVISEVSAWFVVAAILLGVMRLVSSGKWYPEAIVKTLQKTIDTQDATIQRQAETIAEYQALGIAAVHVMKSIQGDGDHAEESP